MDVQLAAGTVFLDVLVWQATISTAEASSEKVPVQTGHAALYRLKGHDGSVHRRASYWIALAFKPNSVFIKQGSTLNAQAQVARNRVSWAPHGRILASASDDRTVRVWALPDEAPNANDKPVTLVAMRILYGHEARVWDVRFWGGLVISASEDCTCRQSLFTLLSAVMGPLHQSGLSIIDPASPGASRYCPGLN